MRPMCAGAMIAAVVCVAGCSAQDAGSTCPTEGCDLTEARTLAYTEPASVLREMSVIAPTLDGSWPVVILAHGTSQHRSAVSDWATGIAAEGALTYNVAWPSGGGAAEASAQNLACAVSVAVDDAEAHGGDTSRVVFVGHSLGAAIGAAAALGGGGHLDECAVPEGDDALPDAFVGYEGPYDHATVDYTNDRAPLDPPGDAAADPYAQIGGNPDLVLRLLHGDAEDFSWFDVPLSVSEDFAAALREAGYDAEVVVVEGGEHIEIWEDSPPQQAVVAQVGELLADL
ncbi:alpha/beta hydrolase family protein [Demequina rhizosphaerae]|uniref:alpha/beta hydrolase family protein n=1 Tax=Demequina rhizosphaerae TaxID=1638985 RepID=UPI00078306E7|nr:alpha/beta hydrolase [Demequina rhizosphaerae]